MTATVTSLLVDFMVGGVVIGLGAAVFSWVRS